MDKYQKLTKTIGILKKIADFIHKNAKIRDIKMLKTTPLLRIITRNYAMNFYQNLKEIPRPLKLEKRKNDKNFQKNLKKIAKTSIILCVCVCSTKTYSK